MKKCVKTYQLHLTSHASAYTNKNRSNLPLYLAHKITLCAELFEYTQTEKGNKKTFENQFSHRSLGYTQRC